jgi:hypothetical protein
MNTLPYQEQWTPVDHHYHLCECGTSISHRKSFIAPEMGLLCHICPNCGRHLNDRLDELPSIADRSAFFPDFYGKDMEGLRDDVGSEDRADGIREG